MPTVSKVKSPNHQDIKIGAQIRALRVRARLTQTELGHAAGITFQQIQKYEKGKNRVASGRLTQIATALGVDPASFFDGGGLSIDERDMVALIKNGGGARLLEGFNAIRSAETRRLVVALVELLGAAPANRNKRAS